MKSVFLEDARLEMIEATHFYNRRRGGLGDLFVEAIERAIADIEEHPRRWPLLRMNIRRRLAGRFPYGILYRITTKKIVIVAIMHLHRRPNYWAERINRLENGLN